MFSHEEQNSRLVQKLKFVMKISVFFSLLSEKNVTCTDLRACFRTISFETTRLPDLFDLNTFYVWSYTPFIAFSFNLFVSIILYTVRYTVFSSPEPSGSQGELIVYPWSGVRRPLSVLSVHTFQTSSPLKPLDQSKPNFMWSLLGKGEQKFI